MGKGYEKRAKVTRIFLDDYLVIKGFSLQAGISMAEALHKLLVGLKPEPKPKSEPVAMATKPAFRVTTPVALPVTAPIVYRSRLITALATNGSKVAAFRIKPKGVRYD